MIRSGPLECRLSCEVFFIGVEDSTDEVFFQVSKVLSFNHQGHRTSHECGLSDLKIWLEDEETQGAKPDEALQLRRLDHGCGLGSRILFGTCPISLVPLLMISVETR